MRKVSKNCLLITQRKPMDSKLVDKILACASGEQSKSEVFGIGEDEFVPWTVGAIL